MLGHKIRDFKPLTAISLDDLVPEDNFYRQVDKYLDLGFVRNLVSKLYSVMGRPSIDPIVFFKLQLIAFFEGIRSERQLMETVDVNLVHRIRPDRSGAGPQQFEQDSRSIWLSDLSTVLRTDLGAMRPSGVGLD